MNRVCSIFSQILQLFPRGEFEKLVGRHQAERHSKGFSSWGQFIAMLFCQLGQAKSLREIHEGLRASEGKLRHLGLQDAPSRSTLADANQHRSHELFRDLFHQTYQRCQAQLEWAGVLGRRIRLPHKLYSLDATVIVLCAQGFDWAQFQAAKGAVKLHLLFGPRRSSAQLCGHHAGEGARDPDRAPDEAAAGGRWWSLTAASMITLGLGS